MRAIVIREPGGPEVLELRELPDPEPPASHVRVRVRFAGVNRADVLQRLGAYPAPPGAPKDIPGLEYAGVVEALGPGASRFRVGDRVHGLVGGGAYADKLVVHEREAAPIPAGLSDEHAAAAPEAFVTAFDALVVRGRMQAGDAVLVSAAGSGVGTAGVQIAARLGATVLGSSRTPDKLERCKELGLGHAIVPKGAAFADAVLAATGGRGADVVLELVGGAYVEEDLRALAPRGRVVVVGLTAGTRADVDLGLVLRKRAEIVGTSLRSRPLEEKIEASLLLERRLGPLFASGALRAVVDAVFPLERADDAHRRLVENDTFGKLLLRC
ncbi:MAG TPA: NAD(P)H-quinone oxidoreductase [Minicystis sp.]|nr:NAD(P)H-quinone oxidoreductase [Minicystis sp.]